MIDTHTWNTLAREITALQAERDELKRRLASTDCTKCGCVRQSSAPKPLVYIAQPYGDRPERELLAKKYMLP